MQRSNKDIWVGLFVLIITGTIDWDDVLSEKSAWDTLIWFGALIMLAEQLNKQGVIGWFSNAMSGAIVSSGMPRTSMTRMVWSPSAVSVASRASSYGGTPCPRR